MLKGYFDASGKGAKDIFVLAGCISTQEKWERFTGAWQAELDGGTDAKKRQRLKLFRLANMNLKSSTSLKRCAIFDEILRAHIMARVAVVVDVTALMKIMRKSWWSRFIDKKAEPTDTAYWYGFRVLNEAFHIERSKREELKPLSGPIDFIFDQENEPDKASLVRAWTTLYETSSAEKRAIIGKMPNFARDHLVLPLQGADLVAGIARRLAARGQSIKGLPTPWRAEHKTPIFTITFEHFESDIQRNLDRVMTAQFIKQLTALS